MLIFDQLNREDRSLQVLSAGILLGMGVLFCGLWWVQIVSSNRYEANLQNQSFRRVRVPALRGKIFDRNGTVLAENRPRYDVNLYFEELVDQFKFQYTNTVIKEFKAQYPNEKITAAIREKLSYEARYRAVSNIAFQVTSALHEPRIPERAKFLTQYNSHPYMPFAILQNLNPQQVALFSEQFTGVRGLELEVQALRYYPKTNAAAHLLGYVQRDDNPEEDEEIDFKYYLPDFSGKIGMERIFDAELRGKAGVKSLLVNNVGYRQREEMVSPTDPGQNVSLTIDADIQVAAEKALAMAMANVRGAVVVMDVRNGDVLALVSQPSFDPNIFPDGITHDEWQQLNDTKSKHMLNRATFGAYPPGSIFKIITAFACLEAGVMNPNDVYELQVDPENRPKGCIYVGRRKIRDTADAGDYDFVKAFEHSSNGYFIHYGLKAGGAKLLELGNRFHLGERTAAFPRQEVSGYFPESTAGLSDGNLANICIGQEITVTPLQMACMTAAVANGGKLFWPRLVKEIQPVSESAEQQATNYPPGLLRADVRLNLRHLQIVREAMRADVADEKGTGRAAYIPNFLAAGKTGTAQVLKKGGIDHITWFVSFAPYESPRYAVVVMVESGASGGGTCAPVAKKIYEAIQKREAASPGLATMATLN